MKINSIKNITLAIVISTLVLACSGNRHYERDTSMADNVYGGQEGDSTQNLGLMQWRDFFNDTVLVNLIDEGLSHNYDLQNAIESVKQAQSYFKQSKAAQWPTVGVGMNMYQLGVAKAAESVIPTDNININSLSGNASWEVDIWGKMRTAKRAAYAKFLGTDAAKKAVQTNLISNIATLYYTLLALDKQLQITEQSVENYRKLNETMAVLKESGRVTGAAVVQSQAAQYAAEISIPDLKQQIKVGESTLSILLGRPEGSIRRSTLSDQQAAQIINIGIPVQLLDNRPDVMQAEYAVMSAYEMVGNAKSYFYPALKLKAFGVGLSAPTIAEMFDPEHLVASFIGGLTAPIFNKRMNRTRLEVAKSQRTQAMNSYKKSLLNAGKEVTDALNQYGNISDKIDLRTKQLDALNKSVNYTQELLIYGSATYTEVLDAQQNLLKAQLGDASDQLQKLGSVVSLYKALGGGWAEENEAE